MRKLLLASVATVAGSLAMTAGAQAQPVKAPAPGAVVVHLNGALAFEMTAVNTPSSNATKYSTINDIGFLRLYPGFDATTEGGLQYGVAAEIRDTSSSTAGVGVNSNVTSGGGSGALYLRRAYGYVGTASAGYLRFGQTDSAFTLMQDGVLEGFGDGQGWNGDGNLSDVSFASPSEFTFSDVGGLYTTSKVVYVSPSFAGFNFAVGFEPNSNAFNQGENLGTAPVNSQSSVEAPFVNSVSNNGNRRRNTIDAMVGYTTEMDGVGLKASAGYLDASPLGNNSVVAVHEKNMGVAQFGAQVTYAGLAVGANVKTGAVNGGYGFLTAGQRHGTSVIVGSTYTMGPVVVGGYYLHVSDAGGYTPTNGDSPYKTTNGVALGATYNISPHFATYAEFLYGEERQNTAAAPIKAHQDDVAVGATLKW